jgi:proteic killer suppression protein
MWHIREHKSIARTCKRLPPQAVKKYEIWKNLVFRHGPEKLRAFPGFREEKLSGNRKGQRSSRLSWQYRVIYEVERDIVTVWVVEITPHDY